MISSHIHSLRTAMRASRRSISAGLFALCLLVWVEQPLDASEVEVDTAKIARYLRAQMRSSGIPGAAVAVVQDGRLVYMAGFGTAGHGHPVTPQTPFILGSVSKPVTSLAVMRLAESGILDLDAPVARYLPEFRIGRDTLAPRITLRHLLHHRSGIPRAAGFQRFDSQAPAPSAYPDVTLDFAPGAAFQYSNLNYVLLGRVIEAVTGEPFGTYLRRAVFDPVGMTSAYTDRAEAEANGLAFGHAFLFVVAVPWREPDYARATIPAGFVTASVEDMARFVAIQMAATGAPQLLSPETLEQMHTPGVGEAYGYAAGWRVVSWAGGAERLIAHDGMTGRYSAAIGFVPESRLAVVVLSNSNAGIFRPPATEMLLSTLRIAQGDDAEPGWPVERLLRAGVALGLLLAVIGFLRRLLQWHRIGYPRGIAFDRRLLRAGGAAVISLSALLLLPKWFGISLPGMLRLQPDLGGALVLGAVVAVVDAVLKMWVPQRPARSTSRKASQGRLDREAPASYTHT